MKLSGLAILLLGLCTTISAQGLPEDPGPQSVGWVDITVSGQPGGNTSVPLRVFYPAITNGQGALADLSAAPYPLVVFGHGFSLAAPLYSTLFENLATRGYVCALVRTEEALFTGSLVKFTIDMRAAVLGMRVQTTLAGTLLGTVSPNTTAAAIGHSFGGAASILAASGHANLFSAVVTHAATATTAQGIDILTPTAALTQPCLHIGTDGDTIVPPASNLDLLYNMTPSTKRKVSFSGGRHSYFHEGYAIDRLLETPGLITVTEQQRLIRRYQNSFLDHYLNGDPTSLDFLLGPTAVSDPAVSDQALDLDEPLTFASRTVAIGAPLHLHTAWETGDVGWLIGNQVQASVSLPPYGLLLVDPANIEISPPILIGPDGYGTMAYLVPNNPALSGYTTYVQSIVTNIGSGASRFANSWTVVLP